MHPFARAARLPSGSQAQRGDRQSDRRATIADSALRLKGSVQAAATTGQGACPSGEGVHAVGVVALAERILQRVQRSLEADRGRALTVSTDSDRYHVEGAAPGAGRRAVNALEMHDVTLGPALVGRALVRNRNIWHAFDGITRPVALMEALTDSSLGSRTSSLCPFPRRKLLEGLRQPTTDDRPRLASALRSTALRRKLGRRPDHAGTSAGSIGRTKAEGTRRPPRLTLGSRSTLARAQARPTRTTGTRWTGTPPATSPPRPRSEILVSRL